MRMLLGEGLRTMRDDGSGLPGPLPFTAAVRTTQGDRSESACVRIRLRCNELRRSRDFGPVCAQVGCPRADPGSASGDRGDELLGAIPELLRERGVARVGAGLGDVAVGEVATADALEGRVRRDVAAGGGALLL